MRRTRQLREAVDHEENESWETRVLTTSMVKDNEQGADDSGEEQSRTKDRKSRLRCSTRWTRVAFRLPLGFEIERLDDLRFRDVTGQEQDWIEHAVEVERALRLREQECKDLISQMQRSSVEDLHDHLPGD